MFRKRLSNPFGSGHQVKGQHWWLQLFTRLRPSSILPTNIAIKYPQKIGTADAAGGGMLLPSRETYLSPSWPFSRHISPAAKFSVRLPPTCFPVSPVASSLVEETSSGVAYVRTDPVEDMLSLLSLFPELGRLTTVPSSQDCSYCLGINPRLSVSTLLAETLAGQSLRKPNSLFSIFPAQASASPTCHISH